ATVLALTKRCHLNYPLKWDQHFRDYTRMVDHLGAPSAAEQEYYLQCRAEVRKRYAIRRVDYAPFEPASETRGAPYPRADLSSAIAFDGSAPVAERHGIDARPGLIAQTRFDALGQDEKIALAQELFVVLGIEQRMMARRDLNKYAVYRAGLRHALRDLYAGWFQDFCLDNLVTLRFAPEHDYMTPFEEWVQQGRFQPAPA